MLSHVQLFCDPTDYNSPDSSIHGIFQARILEWVDISSSRDSTCVSFVSWIAQLCPTLCDPMDSSSPGSSVHGILQVRILEWVAIPHPVDLPSPGIKSMSAAFPAFAGELFAIWATREAQEYWSGEPIPSLRLFLTQELNCSPLHCRQILYQLSYQKSQSLVFTQMDWKLCLNKSLHMDVYRTIIVNCQNFEATKISLGSWMGK